MFGLQTLQHMMRMTRTWDSTMSMIPKGGETIWGGLDWSPEDVASCSSKRSKNNGDGTADHQRKKVNYGRLISFGKDVAETDSSKIQRTDFRVFLLL